jgi:hypothetical protein
LSGRVVLDRLGTHDDRKSRTTIGFADRSSLLYRDVYPIACSSNGWLDFHELIEEFRSRIDSSGDVGRYGWQVAIGALLVRTFLIAIIFLAPAGGAWAANSLPPAYALPGKYRQYSCDQLFNEGRLVSAKAAALSSGKKGGGSGPGAENPEPVVRVPAVLEGAKQPEGTLAVLRQRLDAIKNAAIQSECQIEFLPQK